MSAVVSASPGSESGKRVVGSVGWLADAGVYNRTMRFFVLALFLCASSACKKQTDSDKSPPSPTPEATSPTDPTTEPAPKPVVAKPKPPPPKPSSDPKRHASEVEYVDVPKSEQPPGDAKAGYQALLELGYVGCGLPWSMVEKYVTDTPEHEKVPGRTGDNALVSFSSSVVTTKKGVKTFTKNCLTCHAEYLDGKVYIGLGSTDANFTQPMKLPPEVAALAMTPDEGEEYLRWRKRVSTVDKSMRTLTVGANAADNITAVLFAHRDPKTLNWSDDPLLPLPPYVTPLDVPPWWHVRKKNALYYTAAGRGDLSRLMMLASVLCVDTVETASEIAEQFPNIRAYLETIEPPPYKDKVDEKLAARGKVIFADLCADCHGTYGETDTYPNRVVALDDIGTDPLAAQGGSFYSEQYLDWFKQSFYGKTARLEPEKGYIAPPLDGIWASTPYFHNGSVPTVRAVLDSTSRPAYWKRTDKYDHQALGWVYEEGKPHADLPEEERPTVYDTTQVGYANTGHLFGDDLSDAERTSVIEYLKTL